jgi:hypothetical protein
MFGWFRPKLPLDLSHAVAVDRRMSRLAQAFGVDRLRGAVVVRPNPEFFPEPHHGADEGALRLHRRVCDWMGVHPGRAVLELAPPDANPSWAWCCTWAGGDPGRLILSRACLADPMMLVAALSHGLAQRLLADAGFNSSGGLRALAECLTVFLGLGIFPANATVQQKNVRQGGVFRWSISRHGALTEAQFGYALALFAWLRGEEPTPAWAADLQVNVREPFGQSLKYLAKTGDSQFKPTDDEAGMPEETRVARRIDALGAASRGARLAALWDIQALGPKAAAAVSCLTEMLKAGDDDLQTQAADALGAVGPAAEAVVPALADAVVQDHDRPLRKAAAGALGAIGRRPEAAVPALMDLLKAEDGSERITAAWALGRFGAEAGQAAGFLADMLQDGNCTVAEEAAYALGAIGGVAAAAMPALLKALRRGEGGLPAGAAYALGCMGAAAIDKAVPALRKALRHMDPVVAEEAADALRRLGFAGAENAGASGLPASGGRGAAFHQTDPRFRTA